ncbi:MAG TPA: peptidoglycan editing factor PgeF [Bryobacteraceae bacterium]|nr:peptidoglycan editing factor PgeF [Bryobacteraceae bacterium]
MFTLDSDGVFRAGNLSSVAGLLHGFGTRAPSNWPGDMPTAIVRQVHSSRVVVVDGPGEYGQADALITNRSGFLLAIRTADCVPVLLVDPATHTVAAVHAGWRGTVAGILRETLRAMSERFGTRIPDVLVAIGPAIGQCCFEVGPDVAAAFQPWFPERPDLDTKTNLDLREANARQLQAAGVRGANITILDKCTRCEAGLFHSWRRDADRSGRLISGVGWEI